MDHVVLLTLQDGPPDAGGCGACGTSCANASSSPEDAVSQDGGSGRCATPRAAVLACRDALVAAGATVELVEACSDAEIDAVLSRFDGPARPDSLTWPATPGVEPLKLVIAFSVDGQIRAVVRRMVRRYAPAPSKRPFDLPPGRTMPDLPPVGLLPLQRQGDDDIAAQLDLPRDPAEVAKAVMYGTVHRVDLLRNDGGSVTLHGALLGQAPSWRGQVEVDDIVLATASEPVLACAIANAAGYAAIDDLPLAPGADPADGLVTVAVAVPVFVRTRLGRRKPRVEVRRAHGRAVSVTPVTSVEYIDDGVVGNLARKRSWWIEGGAWGVFRP